MTTAASTRHQRRLPEHSLHYTLLKTVADPLQDMADSLLVRTPRVNPTFPSAVITRENAKTLVFPRVERARRRVRALEERVEMEMSTRFEGLSPPQRDAVLRLVQKKPRANEEKEEIKNGSEEAAFEIQEYLLFEDKEKAVAAEGEDAMRQSEPASDADRDGSEIKKDVPLREKYGRFIKRGQSLSDIPTTNSSGPEKMVIQPGFEEMKRVTKSLHDWSQNMLAAPINLYDRVGIKPPSPTKQESNPLPPLQPEASAVSSSLHPTPDDTHPTSTAGPSATLLSNTADTTLYGDFEVLLNACAPATTESKLSIRLNVMQERNPPLALVASLRANLGLEIRTHAERIKVEEERSGSGAREFCFGVKGGKGGRRAQYGHWYLKPPTWNEYMLKAGEEKNPKPRAKMGGLVQQKLDKIMLTRAKEEAAFQLALTQSYGAAAAVTATAKPGTEGGASDTSENPGSPGEGKSRSSHRVSLAVDGNGRESTPSKLPSRLPSLWPSRQVSRVGSMSTVAEEKVRHSRNPSLLALAKIE